MKRMKSTVGQSQSRTTASSRVWALENGFGKWPPDPAMDVPRLLEVFNNLHDARLLPGLPPTGRVWVGVVSLRLNSVKMETLNVGERIVYIYVPVITQNVQVLIIYLSLSPTELKQKHKPQF